MTAANDRLVVATIDSYTKSLNDMVSEDYVEWGMGKERFRKDPGTNHTWNIRALKATTVGWDAASTFTFAGTNFYARPSLGQSGYACTGLIAKVDTAQCSGDERLFDLVEGELTAHSLAIGEAFGIDFYLDGLTTTRSSNPIFGLAAALKTTGSYGGVAYANFPLFFGSGNNILSSGVHATFSADPIPSLVKSISIARHQTLNTGGEDVVVLLNESDWATVAAAIQSQERQTSPGKDVQSYGANSIRFRGAQLVMSRGLTSSGVYWVVRKNAIEVASPFDTMMYKDSDKIMSSMGVQYFTGFFGALKILEPRACAKVTIS